MMGNKNWDWAMFFCCLNGGVGVVPEFFNIFFQISHLILHIGLLKTLLEISLFFQSTATKHDSVTVFFPIVTV
jgi:hypothetical protein